MSGGPVVSPAPASISDLQANWRVHDRKASARLGRCLVGLQNQATSARVDSKLEGVDRVPVVRACGVEADTAKLEPAVGGLLQPVTGQVEAAAEMERHASQGAHRWYSIHSAALSIPAAAMRDINVPVNPRDQTAEI